MITPIITALKPCLLVGHLHLNPTLHQTSMEVQRGHRGYGLGFRVHIFNVLGSEFNALGFRLVMASVPFEGGPTYASLGKSKVQTRMRPGVKSDSHELLLLNRKP